MAQIEDVETARTMAGLEAEVRLAKADLAAFRRNAARTFIRHTLGSEHWHIVERAEV